MRFLHKFILTLLFILFLSLNSPQTIKAAVTINSATLNGSSNVTVSPSTSITASVNSTISGPNNWQSTTWNTGSGATCVDTTNHTSAGTYTESFSIAAPSSPGTYDVSFIIYSNNTCSSSPSTTFTLTGGMIVSSPTPTPTSTPSPSPSPSSSPGSSPSPTSESTPSSTNQPSTSSTTNFPSVTLSRNGLSFSGTASIENGTIVGVEYSTDNGSTWTKANPSDGLFNETSENFNFTPSQTFKEGNYTILARALSQAQVYTQSSSFASTTLEISAPKVILDKFKENPTKNQRPTITGTINRNLFPISQAQISLDEGTTWIKANLSGNSFNLKTEMLEDGNYEVLARAIDIAGNIGTSGTQTLVVDTIPPIIGGGVFAIGPQILEPDEKGLITTTIGTEMTFAVSIKGGPIKALVKTSSTNYDLTKQPNSDIWTGKIAFKSSGEQPFTVSATDGADNNTERQFNILYVAQPGFSPNSTITLYFYENSLQKWIPWDAQSYGQTNSITTDETGAYSFIVPPGKYCVEVTSPGFYKTQTQILETSKVQPLNFSFHPRPKPKISLNLPFLGKIVLTIPNFFPPDTIHVSTKPQSTTAKMQKKLVGSPAPSFTLPNLDNKITSLSTFLGNKLLLTFLSTWSTKSQEQATILSDLSSLLPQSTKILVISLQENLSKTQSFMNLGKYNFPILVDKTGEKTQEYNINYLPQSFFINKDGKVSEIHIGLLGKDELLQKLELMQ